MILIVLDDARLFAFHKLLRFCTRFCEMPGLSPANADTKTAGRLGGVVGSCSTSPRKPRLRLLEILICQIARPGIAVWRPNAAGKFTCFGLWIGGAEIASVVGLYASNRDCASTGTTCQTSTYV